MGKTVSAVLFALISISTSATVLSPTSREVNFTYTASFKTTKTDSAQSLMTLHAQYLFGYMQAADLSKGYGLNMLNPGLGAPAWPPQVNLVDETREHNGVRVLTYQLSGVLLLQNRVADEVLKNGYWDVILPYDLDNYYEFKCSEWGSENSPDGFWYFYNPFHAGCQKLIEAPLANGVRVRITPMPSVDPHLAANLEDLRGDNGNGELFEIVTANGFAKNAKPNDQGRLAYEAVNDWLRGSGFAETQISRFKNRPVFQYDKIVKSPSHGNVHIRVTRLLADTGLADDTVTFAKFFKNAIESADVYIYAGHAGPEAMFNIEEIEKHAGKVHFNHGKHQLFFFDACSGYSYYLNIFDGQKNRGTLDVLTYGLPSMFGYEHSTHKALLKYLFNMGNDHPEWMDIMNSMEKPLRGMTFMLNYVAI